MLYQVENPWIAKFSALFHINLPNEIVKIKPSEILSCQNCEIIEIPAKLSTSKLIRYWFVSIGGRWNFSISSNVSSTVSKANDFLKSNQPGQAAVVLDALTVLLLAADNERYANLQRYFISFTEKSTTWVEVQVYRFCWNDSNYVVLPYWIWKKPWGVGVCLPLCPSLFFHPTSLPFHHHLYLAFLICYKTQ